MTWIQQARFRPHDLTHSPVGLWQLAGNLNDSSGNGFTLSVGAGTERYSTIRGIQGFFFDGSTWLQRTVHDAALTITGALTIEWICSWHSAPGEGINSLVAVCTFGANSETEADNVLYQPRTRSSAFGFECFHENSTGNNNTATFTDTPPDDTAHHCAITRNSAGTSYSLYVDGIFLESASATNAPTGGTTSRLFVGANETATLIPRMTMASLKIISAELTAAQIAAEAERTVL